MKELGMKRVVEKFIAWRLSQEQMEFHAEVAQDLIETSNNDLYFLKKIIIGDESWVYGCDPKTIAQSC